VSNSAQRLHDALVALRRRTSPNNVEDIWPEAFETGRLTTPQFLRQFAKFLELPDRVRAEIQAAEGELPSELLLEWFPKLQTALKHLYPRAPINEFTGRITDEMLLGLRFSATVLAKHSPEKIISSDALSNLLGKANELRRELVESDLDPEVKRVLVARLDEVISAVAAYRLTGAPGLEESFDAILGSLVREKTVWEKAGDTTVGRKVFNFVKNFGIIFRLHGRLFSCRIVSRTIYRILLPPPSRSRLYRLRRTSRRRSHKIVLDMNDQSRSENLRSVDAVAFRTRGQAADTRAH
jgi:hypothetical protein